MTYLIAKSIDSPAASLSVQRLERALRSWYQSWAKKYPENGVQILTLSDPEVYGKYKQYHFVDSSETFIVTVHGHFLN